VVSSRDRRMTAMIESRCTRDGIRFATTHGSARPATSAWGWQSGWLVWAMLTLAAYPLWVLARSVLARILAGNQRETDEAQSTPAVTITGWYPRHVRRQGRKWDVWYWQEVVDQLESGRRDLRVRFLLYTQKFPFSGLKKLIRPFYTGWSGLRKIERAGSIPQVHAALSAFFAALPAQWSALVRYRRLERSAVFRQSFEFAGADVSRLMVPLVRGSIAGMAKWAQTVGSMRASLGQMGNIKVVLVQEEFYPRGMQTIAAARQLGIETVGVQHGTMGPAHLVYRVPQGHVEGAPNPDFFSVYGEYAKEVVSHWGAYPADRVWVTGGPRFDPIARRAADTDAARQRLDLPADKFIVLLTTWRHTLSYEPSRAVFEVAAGRDDVLVCLKTHPNWSDTTEYRELARRAGAANVRFYQDRLDDLVAACDLMISGSSTTLLDAMLAGKATISVNFQDEPERYPYVADGGALGAQSVEQLRDAIERVRSGRDDLALQEARRKFLKRHVGPSADGRAAETLVTMIDEHFLDPKEDSLTRCA
ncbi:MAG TPA: CDP-glycerol glycerophosphotransferase family protein, partial [Thermoguttaceae bacterium]|nr:CDP-glycerol glycerophosphotransferase family protein [Thermoguttaceae bacterium]